MPKNIGYPSAVGPGMIETGLEGNKEYQKAKKKKRKRRLHKGTGRTITELRQMQEEYSRSSD